MMLPGAPNRRRVAITAVVAGVVVLGALATYLVTRGPRPQGPEAPSGPGQPTASGQAATPEGLRMTKPVIRYNEGGRTAWQVRLKELRVAAGAQAMSANGMEDAIIYSKTGAPMIRLTAQSARGNTGDRSLEVSGDVRAASPRGALITTQRVRWIEPERRLYCPETVTVRTRTAAVTATNLSYYVDTDTVKAPGVVRIYSGPNKIIGRQLTYNIVTDAFDMKRIQAVFEPPAKAAGAASGGGGR